MFCFRLIRITFLMRTLSRTLTSHETMTFSQTSKRSFLFERFTIICSILRIFILMKNLIFKLSIKWILRLRWIMIDWLISFSFRRNIFRRNHSSKLYLMVLISRSDIDWHFSIWAFDISILTKARFIINISHSISTQNIDEKLVSL